MTLPASNPLVDIGNLQYGQDFILLYAGGLMRRTYYSMIGSKRKLRTIFLKNIIIFYNKKIN